MEIMETSAESAALLQIIEDLKALAATTGVNNVINDFHALKQRDQENVTIIKRLFEEKHSHIHQSKTAAEQIQRLSSKVKGLEEELTGTQRELVETRKAAEDRGRRLREETEKVMRLEQYRVDLKTESQDIGSRWSRLWTLVNELATEFFSEDLDRDKLRGASGWEPNNAKKIPSPATNSIEAKQMRIIAVDSIIASSLTEHIFRPVGMDKGFDKSLSRLAYAHPGMESSYRSSHLAVLDKQPEYRDSIIDQAVNAAIADIISSVSRILAANMFQPFRIGLEDVCRTAAQEWRIFQQYTERYEVDLAGNEHCHDPVPLWQPAKAANSPRTNGAAAGKKNDQNQNQPGARRNQRGEGSSVAVEGRPGSVVTSVWPLLKVVDAAGAVPKLKGWALFSSQTQEAEEQVRRASRQEKREEGKQGDQKSGYRPISLVSFLPGSSKSS